MNLELTADEAQFLHDHVARHIEQVESELVHTDKRELQRALALDVDHLRSILQKLAGLVAGS